jgi:hypothetical protein
MYAPPPPAVMTPPASWGSTRSAIVYRNGMAYQMYVP